MSTGAAHTMAYTLRSLDLTDEITAELTVLVGCDQDLALTQFHPSLERVPWPAPGPSGRQLSAGTLRIPRRGKPDAADWSRRSAQKAPRMATLLIDDVFDALDEQTVVVPGTGTLDFAKTLPGPLARRSTNNAGPQKPTSAPCWSHTFFPRSSP